MSCQTDYGALANWAEHDMVLSQNSVTARRGGAAAAAGLELLKQTGALQEAD